MNEKLSKNDLNAINKNLKKLSFYDNGNRISGKRYRISEESFITSGGQAHVYRLLDGKHVSPYVLKVYRDRYSERDYIYQKHEEKNAAVQKLKNANILVPKTRYVFDDRYIVVEDYHIPLEEHKAVFAHNRGRDDIQIAFVAGVCLLECFIDLSTESGKLKYAIYHCDVKPDNILMAGKEIHDGFLLTDFGVAAYDVDKGGGTFVNIGMGGSLATMSPEAYRQDIENLKKSDMYSIGVTLYYYLAGCYPGGAEKSDDEIHKQRLKNKDFKIERPAKGSEKFKDLVMKAMAYDPKDRFDSYTEMYEELKKCREYSKYVEQRYGDGDTVFLKHKTTDTKDDYRKITINVDDDFSKFFENSDVQSGKSETIRAQDRSHNSGDKNGTDSLCVDELFNDWDIVISESRNKENKSYESGVIESRRKKVENFVLRIDDLDNDEAFFNRPVTKGDVYFANYRRQGLAEKNERSRRRKSIKD